MPESTLITFANQKGGVGKSTLCTLFANYLGVKGMPCLVLDCDPQQSIVKRRELEMTQWPEYEWYYQVRGFNLENNSNVERLMQNLRRLPGAVLIDAPGNLIQPGFAALLSMSDYIVVPLQYESSVMTSSMQFLSWVEENAPGSNIFFQPNRFKPYAVTREERAIIEDTDMALEQVGWLCPKIGDYKDIERCRTTSMYSQQQRRVEEAFDFIYSKIFTAPTDTQNQD